MNSVMLSVNRTAPVLIMLSENRPVFFGAYPSRIPARTQAPREDGTVSQEQAGNAVSLCCQTVTEAETVTLFSHGGSLTVPDCEAAPDGVFKNQGNPQPDAYGFCPTQLSLPHRSKLFDLLTICLMIPSPAKQILLPPSPAFHRRPWARNNFAHQRAIRPTLLK